MRGFECGEVIPLISKLSSSSLREVVMTTKHFSCLCIIVCCVLMGSVFARDYNETPAVAQQSAQSEQSSMQLSFDPNDYDFLVYDCGSGEIQTAMDKLGLSYDA